MSSRSTRQYGLSMQITSSAAHEGHAAPLWTREYVLLLTANLFLCFGFHTMPATLPAYVKHLGGSALESSLVVGLFSIFALVFRILGGSASDSARPRSIALLGASIVLASTFSFPFLPIAGLLAARMVEGIGWGLGTAAIATAVSATVAPERRGEGIGYYSLTTILAMGLMSLLAIPAMNSLGFATVAFASSASIALSLLCLILSPRKAAPDRRSGGRGVARRLTWRSLLEPRALLPSGLCFLITVTVCGVVCFLMLYGEEIGLRNVSLFFVGFTAMALGTRPFAGRIYDRRGHLPLVVSGALSMALGLVLLSYARGMPLLVVSSAFFGLGYGAVNPSLQAWSIARSPEGSRGAANGTFLSAMDLSYTLGSMVLGTLAQVTGYAVMYRISVVFLALMLAVYLYALTRSRD
jgi:MFS family permease